MKFLVVVTPPSIYQHHTLEYIRKHEISGVMFYPFQPKFDESVFALGTMDWKDFYVDIYEDLTLWMP